VDQPAAPTPAPSAPPAADPAPHGLGGWLIVVGLHLLINVLGFAHATPDWMKLYAEGQRALHASAAPHRALPLEYLPIVYQCYDYLLPGFAVLLLVLFFARLRWFPRLYIAFLLLNLALATIAYMLVGDARQVMRMVGIDVQLDFIVAAANLVLLGTYTLASERVRNTFGRAGRSA